MSANSYSNTALLKTDIQYMPVLRYAFGITLIMGYAMAFGGDLSYIVPYLALNFLAPGTKMPTLKQGVNFVGVVAVTSVTGFFFTSFFYNYTWVYIPLLGMVLFYIYYTSRLTFIIKLFLLIALLAFPVPMPGIDTVTWAYAITNTLVIGSVFSIMMVWVVYSLFPDKPVLHSGTKSTSAAAQKDQDQKERFRKAFETFIVTFPVVLLFIFYQWGNSLIILIYIVVLSMMQEAGRTTGKVKVAGNLIGGLATIVFYELIIVVPYFPFFILLLLGTALLFAVRIFSKRPDAALYKTGFSALVLIIGGVVTGTDEAGSEIWMRIIQVMTAVFYVVAASAIIDVVKTQSLKRKERKQLKNNIAKR